MLYVGNTLGVPTFATNVRIWLPFGVYKDYQQFLADCWREKDEKEGVDSMPHLSPCRRRDTAEEGDGNCRGGCEGLPIVLRRAVQDGGAHEEEAVAIAEEREEAIKWGFWVKIPPGK